MLKRVFTILFAVLILVQSMRGALVYVSLKVNQDEIAAKYCTSDNIPMCYGNCYIEKQLKSLEKENQKSASSNTLEKSPFWFISVPVEALKLDTPLSQLTSPTIGFRTIPSFLASYLEDIFQPPQFSTF